MKILNFGSCNIDYVYRLEHFVEPGETLSAKSLNIFPGGKGLNQSIAISSAGCRVYHAGLIGNDGMFLKDLLQSRGVITEHLRLTDENSGSAIIEVVPDGENRIIIYSGANARIDESFADSVLSDFNKGDIIVLQNEISCRDYIIKAAHKKGMTIVFNPAPFSEDISLDILKSVSYLVINQTEAAGISGETDTDRIIEKLRNVLPDAKVVLTLGKKGSCYFDSDRIIRQAAFLVDAVDTTAAGDTFIGYFVAGIADNLNMADILKYSCCASALCVTKQGAAVSIPYQSDVMREIKKLKPAKSVTQISEKLKKYFEANHGEVALDEFAREIKYTPSYLTKKIKAETGMSFTGFIQNLRCEKAERLLRETNLSVGEIVVMCGYQNESHFRKLFFKKYGKKPLQYRKTCKE